MSISTQIRKFCQLADIWPVVMTVSELFVVAFITFISSRNDNRTPEKVGCHRMERVG